MEFFGDALRLAVGIPGCPRQPSIPPPACPDLLDVFPTVIKCCFGERCLSIATLSLERYLLSGSTQAYHLSKCVTYLVALFLLTTILLWIVLAWRVISPCRRVSKYCGFGVARSKSLKKPHYDESVPAEGSRSPPDLASLSPSHSPRCSALPSPSTIPETPVPKSPPPSDKLEPQSPSIAATSAGTLLVENRL